MRKRSCCRGRPWWRTDTCSPLSRSRARAWSDASWTRPRSKTLQEGTPVHSPESCCPLFVGLVITLTNISVTSRDETIQSLITKYPWQKSQKMVEIFISCFPSIILWPLTFIFFSTLQFPAPLWSFLASFYILLPPLFWIPMYPKTLRMFWAICF